MKLFIIISILISLINYIMLFSIAKTGIEKFNKDFPNASKAEPMPLYQRIRCNLTFAMFMVPVLNVVILIVLMIMSDDFVDDVYESMKKNRKTLY